MAQTTGVIDKMKAHLNLGLEFLQEVDLPNGEAAGRSIILRGRIFRYGRGDILRRSRVFFVYPIRQTGQQCKHVAFLEWISNGTRHVEIADGELVGELLAGRVREWGQWSAGSFKANDCGERWRYGSAFGVGASGRRGDCHRGYAMGAYRSSEWVDIVDERAKRSKLREGKRESLMQYLVAAERVQNS